MKIIKNYTKKLLKDLDDASKWEDELFSIKNKEHKFEIVHPDSLFFVRILLMPNIEFNLIEKFLIWRRSSKIKKIVQNKNITDYFNN